MFGHSKDVMYDKNMKVFDDSDSEARLLEKEEWGVIGIFTAVVLAALIVAYVF